MPKLLPDERQQGRHVGRNLSRETQGFLARLPGAQASDYIPVRFKPDFRPIREIFFACLACLDPFGRKIRNSCREYAKICFRPDFFGLRIHFTCGLHSYAFDSLRNVHFNCRAADCRNFGAPQPCTGGQCAAHTPCGGIGPETHPVPELACRAKRNQHIFACHILRGKRAQGSQKNFGQFCQPASSFLATGGVPNVWPDYNRPPFLQDLHIFPCGRMCPHSGVHGRRDNQRPGKGQGLRGKHIRCRAPGKPGNGVCGSGRDYHRTLFHTWFKMGEYIGTCLEHFAVNRFGAQGFNKHGADKLARAGRQC